jgi:hypothetical protein
MKLLDAVRSRFASDSADAGRAGSPDAPPIDGSDALDAEQAAAALQNADLATLDRTSEYERKFDRRQPVLDEMMRVRRRLRAGEGD